MPSRRALRLIFAFIGMDLGTLVSSMALNIVTHRYQITCYPGLRKILMSQTQVFYVNLRFPLKNHTAKFDLR